MLGGFTRLWLLISFSLVQSYIVAVCFLWNNKNDKNKAACKSKGYWVHNKE